jgi:tubulin polyglutamylase TTLL4
VTQGTILDILTPTDVRTLAETLDEDSRRGNFQRIFPSPSTHKYMKYFEQPRYFNLLLDQWVQKYNRMEARGKQLSLFPNNDRSFSR